MPSDTTLNRVIACFEGRSDYSSIMDVLDRAKRHFLTKHMEDQERQRRVNQERYGQQLARAASMGALLKEKCHMLPVGTFVRVTGTRDGLGIRCLTSVDSHGVVGRKYIARTNWDRIKRLGIDPTTLHPEHYHTEHGWEKISHVWHNSQWLSVRDFLATENQHESN